jgi:hypothetical protein
MKIFISLTACFVLMAVAAAGQSAKPPRIGIVQNPDEFDGAGCRLQLPSDYKKGNDRTVFVSNVDEEAIMNIDGTDVRMYRVSVDAVGTMKGSHAVERYRKDDIEADVDFVVTKRCHPDDENCEVTWFNAVITVKRGQLMRKLSTKGICGS